MFRVLFIRRKRRQVQLVLSHVESHATTFIQQRDSTGVRDDFEQSICRSDFCTVFYVTIKKKKCHLGRLKKKNILIA